MESETEWNQPHDKPDIVTDLDADDPYDNWEVDHQIKNGGSVVIGNGVELRQLKRPGSK